MTKKDSKVLKKAIKTVKKVVKRDPEMIDIVGRTLLITSLKKGPQNFVKVWEKTAKKVKKIYSDDDIDSIVAMLEKGNSPI